MRRHKALSRWMILAAIGIGAGFSNCQSTSNTTDPNGNADLSVSDPFGDLAGVDIAGADLTSGGGPTADSACNTHAQSYCAKLMQCAPFSYNFTYTSMSQCAARNKQYCLLFFGLSGSKRTAAEIERCAQAVAPLSCMEYYDSTSPTQVGCRSAGTLADGTPCGASDQCQSQYCNLNYTTGCGVCTPYVKVGSACQTAAGSPTCEPGSFCMGMTGSQKCVASVGLGSACNLTTGPNCKYPLACRSGVCSQPKVLNDTCEPTVVNDCDSTQNLGCNSTNKKCEQIFRFVTAGMSCGSSATPPFTYCGGSSRCTVTTGTGTCIAPAADDAACSDTAPPGCQAVATCRSGFCRLPTPASCK